MKLCPRCSVPCDPWYVGGKRKMLARKPRPAKSDPRYPASTCPVCGGVVLETEIPEERARRAAGE